MDRADTYTIITANLGVDIWPPVDVAINDRLDENEKNQFTSRALFEFCAYAGMKKYDIIVLQEVMTHYEKIFDSMRGYARTMTPYKQPNPELKISEKTALLIMSRKKIEYPVRRVPVGKTQIAQIDNIVIVNVHVNMKMMAPKLTAEHVAVDDSYESDQSDQSDPSDPLDRSDGVGDSSGDLKDLLAYVLGKNRNTVRLEQIFDRLVKTCDQTKINYVAHNGLTKLLSNTKGYEDVVICGDFNYYVIGRVICGAILKQTEKIAHKIRDISDLDIAKSKMAIMRQICIAKGKTYVLGIMGTWGFGRVARCDCDEDGRYVCDNIGSYVRLANYNAVCKYIDTLDASESLDRITSHKYMLEITLNKKPEARERDAREKADKAQRDKQKLNKKSSRGHKKPKHGGWVQMYMTNKSLYLAPVLNHINHINHIKPAPNHIATPIDQITPSHRQTNAGGTVPNHP